MEAGKKTISDIFNGNRILEIPFFQRAYVWEDKQWERLLEDMKEISQENAPYFLGSVILKQQMINTRKSVSDVRTLIDGQQRLTTLSIFLKVLCLKNSENNKFERVFKLIDGNIALEHNHNDIDNYNYILNLKEEEEIDKADNISKSYTYFKENIKIEELDFQIILSNVMFVGIDLGADEDEQQIFDTINSLGVTLTTAELLKNYLFGRNDLKSYDDNWKQVFEKDDGSKSFWDKEITAGRVKRENIDIFFYSFLQIKLQDKSIAVKPNDKKRLSKFSNLFENYKEFIKKYDIDKTSLIQEIKEYAILYQEKIKFNVIKEELTDEYGIDRINALIFGLDITTIIPFVLYVLNKANKEDQKNIFMYLESYLMRRMIVQSTNKSYSKLFSEELISNEVISKDKFQDLINKKTDKDNYMPSNKEVEYGFSNSKLINKQTRGIIYLIESVIRRTEKDKHSTGLLGLNGYSLEHIMPKKWENNWDKNKSFSDKEKEIRNHKLLTLGNLAIITSSLNSSIRDADWNIKKNGKGKYGGLSIFSNGIETINKYLQHNKYHNWDEQTINERANFLYNKAMKIWSL